MQVIKTITNTKTYTLTKYSTFYMIKISDGRVHTGKPQYIAKLWKEITDDYAYIK